MSSPIQNTPNRREKTTGITGSPRRTVSPTSTKASVSLWNRHKSKILIVLALLVLSVLGYASYYFLSGYLKDARLQANLKETRQVMDEVKNLTPEEGGAKLKELFERQQNLPEAERKALWEALGKERGNQMKEAAVTYLRLGTQEERDAFLDKQMAQMEEQGKVAQAMRASGFNPGGPGGGGRAGGGGGPGGGGGQGGGGQGGGGGPGGGQGDFQGWRRAMLDNSTPEERSAFDLYRTALRQRFGGGGGPR